MVQLNNKGTKIEKKEKAIIKVFSKLTQKQRDELEFMISNSKYSAVNIIQVLKEEWGVYRDYTERTLTQYLADYNTYVLKPRMVEKIKDSDMYSELMTLSENYDAIKELTITVRQQRRRTDRAVHMEEKYYNEGVAGKEYRLMCSQARQEIKLLGEMIEKLATLHMKTGTIKTVPKHITGSVTRRGDTDQIEFSISEDFMDHIEDIEAEIIDIEADDG